jgi:presenilin-like A22 family membrane protease
MKYNLKIIFTLIALFLSTQLIGLGLVYKGMNVQIVNGTSEVSYGETSLGPRPQTYGWETFVWVIGSVTISTLLVLLIIRLGKVNWWRTLFFTSVFLTISLSLGVLLSQVIALTLAFILAIVKIYKPNPIIHNLTEILMYSGIAILLVPLFDIEWVTILLLGISLYDVYAVFKSKHMVKMALFQAKSKTFAGISVPVKKTKKGKKGIGAAIIGGGDLAFPLIFAGVVMERLISVYNLTKEIAFMRVLIIPIITTFAILILLMKGKEGKFYPAMPFVTAGCLLGYLLVLII